MVLPARTRDRLLKRAKDWGSKVPKKKLYLGIAGAAAGAGAAALQGSENTKDPARNAITQYHDIARDYYKRRKKVPKKTRIKRRKFKKAVTRVLNSKQSISTYREKPTAAVAVATPGGTTWGTTPFQMVQYGGSATPWSQMFTGAGVTYDLRILQTEIAQRQERFAGVDKPGKTTVNNFIVTHSNIEFSIVNLLSVAWNVDVYELVAARDMSTSDGYTQPGLAWTQCISDLTAENTAFNSVGVTDFGLQPTDVPGFGKHWTIKNKTTIYMAPNQSTAFKCKGPKGFYNAAKANNLACFKGRTTAFMFVFASKIGYGLPAATTFCNIYWQKTYHYKFQVGQGHIPGINIAQTSAY